MYSHPNQEHASSDGTRNESKNESEKNFKGEKGLKDRLLFPSIAILAVLTSITASCANGLIETAKRQAAVAAVSAFLDACGEGRVEEIRGFFSESYLEQNQVPEPLHKEDLIAALGKLSSYSFKPEDLRFEGERAVAPVRLLVGGEEDEREEFVSLEWDGSRWLVTSFTAMDWRRKPVDAQKAIALAEARSALCGFLADCIDHRTERVFAALSRSFREKHRLERPWTRQEFSGVFGIARSYRFDPDRMIYEGEAVEVDVTIEFGSPGNLEEQTSRVRLVTENGTWKVDVFPFFLL